MRNWLFPVRFGALPAGYGEITAGYTPLQPGYDPETFSNDLLLGCNSPL